MIMFKRIHIFHHKIIIQLICICKQASFQPFVDRSKSDDSIITLESYSTWVCTQACIHGSNVIVYIFIAMSSEIIIISI